MAGPSERVRERLRELHSRRLLVGLLPDTVRRSVLAKFMVALLVVVLLGSLVGGVFYAGIATKLDQQVETEVRATTQMHATIYDNWIGARHRTLSSLASSEDILAGSLDQASRQLSLVAARNDIYTDIHLLALDSGVVVASSREAVVDRNYYALGLNETVMKRGGAFVYPGRYRTFGNRTVVGLVVRLQSAGRVLVAEVDPRAGPDPPQTVTGASTLVVDQEGERIFGPSTVPNPDPPPDLAARTELVRSGDTLVSYRQLPRSKLVLVRRTPSTRAFAVKQAVLFSFASTLVLVFGILIVVSVVSGRAAAADLRRLVERANAIARGDLQVDFETTRKDEIGQLYAAFAEMRDSLRERITETETAREEAQQARAEIEEQKAIISVLNRVLRHNLRNDLVVINGHTSVLRERLGDAVEHVEKIRTRTDDLLDKAEKAREIERLVSKDAQQLVTIDLVEVVESETERFRREFSEADITLETPESAHVRGQEALAFVISNLVENAIEHNDSPRPTVEVTVSKDAGTVTVEIADDGPGIPQSELESLEEGYETATEHGTGLGLWLVNWLVDAMDGELRFERRDPTGTVVTIRLDAAPSPRSSAERPETTS